MACPASNFVRPGLPLSAAPTSALDCSFEDDFGQGVLTGHMTRLALFQSCKEWFLTAWVGVDLLPDKVFPVVLSV